MQSRIKQALIKNLGQQDLRFNEPLKTHTTFAIGGPAEAFYVAKTTEDLIKAVKLARNLKISFFILGSGSNILVSDQDLKGITIKNLTTNYQLLATKIQADSGIPLSKLVKLATQNSLSGLEFAAGIPGTLGGAIVGNSGTKTGSISDVVEKVTVLGKETKDTPGAAQRNFLGVEEKLEVCTLTTTQCLFSYRSSRFKKSGEIILSATLKLKEAKKQEIKNKIKKVLKSRKNQPWGKSAGSIFKNPSLLKHPVLQPRPTPGVKFSAGALIEQVGLKGYQIGNAEISPKHANFIINRGRAKADDVLKLIALIKKKIWQKFKVRLEEEIVIV